ncbi:protein of unknown function DUF1524 RloF [Actinobacteria bacterium OV450]|nr:protein of unknown function DUF1524 RloF [Actinobacteria bacterium OV450]
MPLIPVVYARRIGVIASAASFAALTSLVNAPLAQASPPAPISAAAARSYLATVTPKTEGSLSGYSRSLFPHWITVSGSCNTRETVLKRDGVGVATDSSCAAVSGSWYSEYDGATWTNAADLDIDHVVPLAEAWRSGAASWTTPKRQQFANDLTRPQLIAVTDNVNQAKGDQDPGKWLPSRTAYRCTYARMWVDVKQYWGLNMDSGEKTALVNILNGC